MNKVLPVLASGKREHKPASVPLQKRRNGNILSTAALFHYSLFPWNVDMCLTQKRSFSISPAASDIIQALRGHRQCFKPGVKSGYHCSLLLHSHGWVHITRFPALIKPKVAIKKPDELQTTAVAVVFYFTWNGSTDTS